MLDVALNDDETKADGKPSVKQLIRELKQRVFFGDVAKYFKLNDFASVKKPILVVKASWPKKTEHAALTRLFKGFLFLTRSLCLDFKYDLRCVPLLSHELRFCRFDKQGLNELFGTRKENLKCTEFFKEEIVKDLENRRKKSFSTFESDGYSFVPALEDKGVLVKKAERRVQAKKERETRKKLLAKGAKVKRATEKEKTNVKKKKEKKKKVPPSSRHVTAPARASASPVVAAASPPVDGSPVAGRLPRASVLAAAVLKHGTFAMNCTYSRPPNLERDIKAIDKTVPATH